jgi:hypothetical protein
VTLETANLGMEGLARLAAQAVQNSISRMFSVCWNVSCEPLVAADCFDSEGDWQVGGLADPAIPSPPVS